LDIFSDLTDEMGRGIETNFISNSLFKIDLDFIAVDVLTEVQNIDLQGKRALLSAPNRKESRI
jgi:hypothetical protein